MVYTLTVTNAGALASDGAQLNDALPAGVALVSAPGCVATGGTQLRCAVGSLAAGASRVFTVTVTLANPYNGATPLTNTATLDAPGDPNTANNTASVSTPVVVPSIAGIPTLSQWLLVVLSLLLAAAVALQRAGTRRGRR